MFDFGFTELLIVGVVSLIVVGPKDLPIMFRNVGRVMGKARGMAREFSRAMDAAADEVGMKEINKTLKAASNPKAYGLDKLREASGIDGLDASVRSSISGTSKVGDKGAKAALPKPSAPAPGSETEALAAKRAEERKRWTEEAKARREAARAAAAETAVSPAASRPADPASSATDNTGPLTLVEPVSVPHPAPQTGPAEDK